jgi:hypothetical protein
MANFPTLLGEERQSKSDYLLIPKVSSENRKYIPIEFVSKEVIATDKVFVLQNASLYIYRIITSMIHMAWTKYTVGRLKSDYSYSNSIFYNNYPFPQNVSETNIKKVEEAAQAVLDIRAKYPSNSLADLYAALSMPPDLVKAHQALDKAVDLCYRPQAFVNELARIEYLFGLYEAYTAPMFQADKKKR